MGARDQLARATTSKNMIDGYLSVDSVEYLI